MHLKKTRMSATTSTPDIFDCSYECEGCHETFAYDDRDKKGGICYTCKHCSDCGCECECDNQPDEDEDSTTRRCDQCDEETSCWNYNDDRQVVCTDCDD